MTTTVRVEGLRELGVELSKLRADVAGRIGRAATAAGANVIVREARRLAPKKTGAGAKGIVSKRERNTNLTSEHAIGYRKVSKADKNGPKDGWYMRLVELGTVKMAPQPHLRPALENKKEQATQAVADRIRKRLERVK